MNRTRPYARALEATHTIARGNPLDTRLHDPFSRRCEELERESFATLEAYWNDPEARARIEAEGLERCASIHAVIDAGMAESNRRQRARWEAEALHGSENGNG